MILQRLERRLEVEVFFEAAEMAAKNIEAITLDECSWLASS